MPKPGKMSSPDRSIMERSLRSAGHILVIKTLSQPVTFLATVLLMRALSEESYGIYSLFQSLLPVMGMVASLGLSNTLQRFVPEFLAQKRYRVAWDLYRAASLIRLLVNILIVGLILLSWEWLAPHFGLENYRNLFLFFSAIILLYMQSRLLETCLYGYFLHKQVQISALLLSSIKSGGYGLAIVLHWDLRLVLVVDLVAHLTAFILLRLIMARSFPKADEDPTIGMGPKERKRFINYAMYYNFNDAGSGILGNQFDNFFVAAYLDPIAVGGYAFCNRLAEYVDKMMPTRYFRGVIKPAFFSYGDKLRPTRIRRVYQSLAKINYLFNIPILCFMISASVPLIDVVFAGKFREFAPLFVAILMFQTIQGFFKSIDTIAQLRERADIILFSKLFAIPNIGGNILLIPIIGVWGPVFATGLSQLGRGLFIWYHVRESVNFKGMLGTLLKTSLFWGSTTLVCHTLSPLLDSSTLKLLLALSLFGISTLLFFRLDLLNRFEKVLLRDFSNRQPKMGRLMRYLGVRLS